jgi:hypothetical protein
MPEQTVEACRAKLVELEASIPEMPRGLDANHPLFIEWHLAYSAHVAKRERLQCRITALSHPIELGVRQERPKVALPVRAPRRLRQ